MTRLRFETVGGSPLSAFGGVAQCLQTIWAADSEGSALFAKGVTPVDWCGNCRAIHSPFSGVGTLLPGSGAGTRRKRDGLGERGRFSEFDIPSQLDNWTPGVVGQKAVINRQVRQTVRLRHAIGDQADPG